MFGRTKRSGEDGSAGKSVFIDNKNVSRKHTTIKVHDVPPEDGTKLHKRSQIEVTDFSCRQGTIIDGEKTLKSSKEADGTIVEDKATLTGTQHTIRLSSSYPAFTLKWQDVVVTYATREKKGVTQSQINTESQTNTRNAKLHAMDMKTSYEFVGGKTTHTVAGKRNLPRVLQALVSGTPIVTTDYLDEILKRAAHSVDSDGSYVPSQLEEDFDTWWPKETDYIPPVGKEPVPRPAQMLASDPSRAEVFSGLTFIFLNEAQHTSLHQVIAAGSGKALLYDIRLGETTVEEYVDYVRSVAGQKKRGRPSNNGLPVVTIRLSSYPDELKNWATNFVINVDRTLNQRSIQQNEFLDAIITKDVSSLRQPPTETDDPSSIPVPESNQSPLREPTPVLQSRAPSQAPEGNSVLPVEPIKTNPRKRPARRAVTSRFAGFDDYEPPSKSRKIEETSVEETPMEGVQQSTEHPMQPSLQNNDPSIQSPALPVAQPQRTVQPSIADQMFPAAAEMRKIREATRAVTVTTTASVRPDARTQTQDPKQTQTILERMKAKQQEREKKLKKEINVKEETRKRMADAEDKRREEEEKLRTALEGVDISKMHVDVQIEGMKMRPREDRVVGQSQLHGRCEGWNPEWDGRKNFKGFRRRGTDNREERSQSNRVIVTLKAAPPRKGFGDSMVMNEEVPVRTAADEKRLRKRNGGRLPESDDERPIGFRRKARAKATEVVANTPTEVINIEDSGPDEEEMPGASGSTIRNSGRTQRVMETQLEDSQAQRDSRKRPGGPLSVAAGQPSAKKSRIARRNEDSDGEEGGFRLARRRRA